MFQLQIPFKICCDKTSCYKFMQYTSMCPYYYVTPGYFMRLAVKTCDADIWKIIMTCSLVFTWCNKIMYFHSSIMISISYWMHSFRARNQRSHFLVILDWNFPCYIIIVISCISLFISFSDAVEVIKWKVVRSERDITTMLCFEIVHERNMFQSI